MAERKKDPEERLEEVSDFSTDKSFGRLQQRELSTKKELSVERHELGILLGSLPEKPPEAGTKEYHTYTRILTQIDGIKKKISKKHDELMEILKTEEKISQEINRKDL